MAYLGQGAEGNFTTTNAKDRFSGDGSTTAFTLSQRGTENNVDVFVNNVRQEPGVAYNIEGNGTSLVFTAAPSTGTNNIYVVNRGPAELSASHPATQNLEAVDGTFTGDLTIEGGVVDINGNELILDADGDTSITSDTDDVIDFKTGGTDRAKFDANGNLVLKKNLILESTSEGIDFSGIGSSVKTLDDYEEGSWTPTLDASTTSPTVGYDSSFRTGTYVKIGKLVYVTFIMDLSSLSGGSGTTLITNLPFTVENNNASYGAQPLLVDFLDSDERQVHLQPIPNQTNAAVTNDSGKNGGHGGLSITLVNASSNFRGSMTYRTH